MPFRSLEDFVDLQAVDALFADMGAEASGPLLEAAVADTTEWTERLVSAWQQGDEQAQNTARHSLKGLCGFFGMKQLLDLSSGDLSGPDARQALRDCRDASLSALRAAVTGLQ